jgi:GAF domain-containing protein
MEPLRAFAELGCIKFSETDFAGVAERIVDLARRVLPGANEVSVTYFRDRRPGTPAASGDLARRLDEAQYEQHSGPCLTAAADDTVVSIVDTATERRFAAWAAVAAAAGIGSALSVGLPVRGSLNLYGRATGAFDDDTRDLARTFAGSAAAALANAHLYETSVTVAEQLREAMEHRAVIEQAKGILMSERRCTADEAFAILTRLSQDRNRKLRDIAAALVTRTVTGPGGRPPPLR